MTKLINMSQQESGGQKRRTKNQNKNARPIMKVDS